MEKKSYTSLEITENFIGIGEKKAHRPIKYQFLLAFMAGMFLGLVCQATNFATHTISSVGISKTLAGVIFPAGLILILLAGSELFTGNCLISITCLEKKAKWSEMAMNLTTVYIGNFIGSLMIVFLMIWSGQFDASGGLVGAYTMKVALAKVSLDFIPALIMGILCNILVCLGVWLAYSTDEIAGKILGMFFPIWVFVISGFEHSIANMYYIPAGILAKANPAWVAAAETYGIGAEQLANLTWSNMLLKNLLPVTIGNIIGGAFFIGFMYWYIHLKNRASK